MAQWDHSCFTCKRSQVRILAWTEMTLRTIQCKREKNTGSDKSSDWSDYKISSADDDASTLALNPMGRVNRSPKYRVPLAPQNGDIVTAKSDYKINSVFIHRIILSANTVSMWCHNAGRHNTISWRHMWCTESRSFSSLVKSTGDDQITVLADSNKKAVADPGFSEGGRRPRRGAPRSDAATLRKISM